MANEIYIFGEITYYANPELGTSLKQVEDKLSSFDGGDVLVKIDSIGGSVSEGFAIFHALRRYAKDNRAKITTLITGECASIAVVVLLAGDTRIGTQHAQPFVHNPYKGHVEGKEAEDVLSLMTTKKEIAKLYASRAKINYVQAMRFMDAETSLTAEQCLQYGFITEIEPIYNKKTITNQNYFKMKRKTSIFNRVLQILGGVKNKIVYTAEEGVTLDFYQLEEDDIIEVGDVATVDGVDADGKYVVEIEGVTKTLTFEAGVLTEISGEDLEVTAEQVEELIERIEELEVQNKALKSRNHSLNSAIEKIKNLEPEFAPNTSRNQRRGVNSKGDKMDYLTKFKKK